MIGDTTARAVIYPGGRRTYVTVVGLVNLLAWGSGLLLVLRRGHIDLITVIVLVVCSLFLFKLARSRVALSQSGLCIRKFAREKKISWANVREFRIKKFAGMRQLQLVLHDGKVINLPAPTEAWPTRDGRFDKDFEILMMWKTRHG